MALPPTKGLPHFGTSDQALQQSTPGSLELIIRKGAPVPIRRGGRCPPPVVGPQRSPAQPFYGPNGETYL